MIGRWPFRNEADVFLAELVARRHHREAAGVTSNAKNVFGGKKKKNIKKKKNSLARGWGVPGIVAPDSSRLFNGHLPKGRRCLFMIMWQANYV